MYGELLFFESIFCVLLYLCLSVYLLHTVCRLSSPLNILLVICITQLCLLHFRTHTILFTRTSKGGGGEKGSDHYPSEQ